MSSEVFERSVELPVSADRAFAWHERDGALARLIPPWQRVRVESRQGTIREGDRTTLRVRVGPVWRRWIAEHHDYQPGRRFRDIQIVGPFARWEHEHRFEPIDDHRCRLVDRVEYTLPGGSIGAWLGHKAVARDLARTFAWRHRTLQLDLAQLARHADQPPLTVAITGATGFVGSALTNLLTTAGHRVRPITRRAIPNQDAILWDTRQGLHDPQQLRDVDAVIHLAGESVFGRWTPQRKQRIRDSRILGTQALVRSIGQADPRPRILLTASGMNYYGNRGDDLLDESAPRGKGFLADVVAQWEDAARQAESAGLRVASLRLGLVLDPRGGALATMLPAFRLGLAGVVGSGKQYTSWITRDDVAAAFHHALLNDDIAGPVNATSPNPVTNAEFTRILGRVLRRPTILPAPASILRLALGDMADETLLFSARLQPARLQSTNYTFRDPQLEPALRHLLGRSPQ